MVKNSLMLKDQSLGYVDVINENWQKVIAESVFKYAGYKSLVALKNC